MALHLKNNNKNYLVYNYIVLLSSLLIYSNSFYTPKVNLEMYH